MSLKGILKYAIYGFIAGWMFLLGIMVGRGNAPITFDTRKFQDRLASIAREYGKSRNNDEKVELEFYDVLDNPAQPEVVKGRIKPRNSSLIQKPDRGSIRLVDSDIEITDSRTAVQKEPGPDHGKPRINDPVAKEMGEENIIPIKTSLKKATLNKQAMARAGIGGGEPPAVKQGSTKAKPYTIQVASFQSLQDAEEQIAVLKQKGFTGYRNLKNIKGVTWHRVRSGSFSNPGEAAGFLETLKKANISGMIIKKEHE